MTANPGSSYGNITQEGLDKLYPAMLAPDEVDVIEADTDLNEPLLAHGRLIISDIAEAMTQHGRTKRDRSVVR